MISNPANRNSFRRGTRRLQLTVLVLCCVALGFGYAVFSKTAPEDTPTEFASGGSTNDPPASSKFPHGNAMHSRLPCLLCHKREPGSIAPKMPGHMPCAGCHVQQFADNTSPLCVICHTSTSVKPFPGLRSFNVMFDHGKHQRQANCATCHSSIRRGVAFSVPSGVNAHATCFRCHGPQTEIGGRNIGSCGVCHQPGIAIRGSDHAKAYSENFSHQSHIRPGNMNCSTCHSVRSGATRGRQVSAPLALNHSAPAGAFSCASCHNNKKAFGGDDFKDCRRCHTGKSFAF